MHPRSSAVETRRIVPSLAGWSVLEVRDLVRRDGNGLVGIEQSNERIRVENRGATKRCERERIGYRAAMEVNQFESGLLRAARRGQRSKASEQRSVRERLRPYEPAKYFSVAAVPDEEQAGQ